ncbi:POK19 protein, partial [Calyptomena viridis]|nr:POK19 protein [Calyptomena viridis]
KHVIKHLRGCFAVMGVPCEIKTDNGPGYVARQLHAFLQLWGIKHTRGIPHSPTGQAVVERAHQV